MNSYCTSTHQLPTLPYRILSTLPRHPSTVSSTQILNLQHSGSTEQRFVKMKKSFAARRVPRKIAQDDDETMSSNPTDTTSSATLGKLPISS